MRGDAYHGMMMAIDHLIENAVMSRLEMHDPEAPMRLGYVLMTIGDTVARDRRRFTRRRPLPSPRRHGDTAAMRAPGNGIAGANRRHRARRHAEICCGGRAGMPHLQPAMPLRCLPGRMLALRRHISAAAAEARRKPRQQCRRAHETSKKIVRPHSFADRRRWPHYEAGQLIAASADAG